MRFNTKSSLLPLFASVHRYASIQTIQAKTKGKHLENNYCNATNYVTLVNMVQHSAAPKPKG
jgi:hypothetical protein